MLDGNRFASVLLAAAFLIYNSTPAQAQGCGTYSSNVTLTADVSTSTTGTCFTLTGGADLNLGNHNIECTLVSGTCGTAVLATGTTSRVYNGSISGSWSKGVHNAKIVDTMLIAGALTAIAGDSDLTDRIEFNNLSCEAVLCPTCDVGCVDVVMTKNTQFISDNTFYASGSGIRIVGREQALSGRGPRVERNEFVQAFGTDDLPMIRQVGATKEIRYFDNVEPPHSANTTNPCHVDNTALYSSSLNWGGNLCSPTDADAGDALCCQ